MVIANPALESPAPSGALQRIDAATERLTPTERHIAALVLEDPARVVLRGISQLAAELGVTQPSLSRFAKSLGFPGFRELRLAIARDIAAPDSAGIPPRASAEDEVLARLAANCANASAVEVWAGPELQSAAAELAARLQRLGIGAAAEVGPAYWDARASGAAPGAICLLLAAGPEDRVWTAGVQAAQKAGLPVAAITHDVPPRAVGIDDIVYFARSAYAFADAAAAIAELDVAVQQQTGALLDPRCSSRRTWPNTPATSVAILGASASGEAPRMARVALLAPEPNGGQLDHGLLSLSHTLRVHGLDVLMTNSNELDTPLTASVLVTYGMTTDAATAAAATSQTVSGVAVLPRQENSAHPRGIVRAPIAVSFFARNGDGFHSEGLADERDLSHRNALVAQWVTAQIPSSAGKSN